MHRVVRVRLWQLSLVFILLVYLFIFYFSLSFLLLSTIVVLTLLLSYGASTPLAASTETSGVRDSMSGTPIAYVNSTDVLYYGKPI